MAKRKSPGKKYDARNKAQITFDGKDLGKEYKLSAYIPVIVQAPGNFELAVSLVGKRCHLSDKRDAAYVVVEGVEECFLQVLDVATTDNEPSICNSVDELEETETDARSPIEKKLPPAGKGVFPKSKRGAESLITQLHELPWLEAMAVQGHVLAVDQETLTQKIRAMVLLDLHLPVDFWLERCFWKAGPASSFVFSHASCDWERRLELLKLIDRGQGSPSQHSSCSVPLCFPPLGSCHVAGCKLHFALTEKEKGLRFNLPALFSSLPQQPDSFLMGSSTPMQASRRGPSMAVGFWSLPEEVVLLVLSRLLPADLRSTAAVCRHTRQLAASIMPCLQLRLYPHQRSAVGWMLRREQLPQEIPHPLLRSFDTEDGLLHYCVNEITGDVQPLQEKACPRHLSSYSHSPIGKELEKSPSSRGGEKSTVPELYYMDFRGGLFCDEPGLGKTITALSLVLKTQGTLAEAPPAAQVQWCQNPLQPEQRVGFYAVPKKQYHLGSALKRSAAKRVKWNTNRWSLGSQAPAESKGPSQCHAAFSEQDTGVTSWAGSGHQLHSPASSPPGLGFSSLLPTLPGEEQPRVRQRRGTVDDLSSMAKGGEGLSQNIRAGDAAGGAATADAVAGNDMAGANEEDNWVSCDECGKWRKLLPGSAAHPDGAPWFCRLNPDKEHADCRIPEADLTADNVRIRQMIGFHCPASEPGGQPRNVAYFCAQMQSYTPASGDAPECIFHAVNWLLTLSPAALAKLANPAGLALPRELSSFGCQRVLPVIGLVCQKVCPASATKGKNIKSKTLKRSPSFKKDKSVDTWCYPENLDPSLALDRLALEKAFMQWWSSPDDLGPQDNIYLSRATLVVVPANLISHWVHQIERHTAANQLRFYVWDGTDRKPPPVASLAWDYELVITTFQRLSLEWTGSASAKGPAPEGAGQGLSPLMRIHWLRVMLDEGHTLGSLGTTNRLQMAIALRASRRWILTGTPTPNTPSSQVAHLQPLLKFLHEGVYGEQQRLWEVAIRNPFEQAREEGRARLETLLKRCMVCASKKSIASIPTCTRQVTLLDFTEAHAATYNELVESVQRNILLADWGDPDHVESLLNPANWKLARDTVHNVRLSCCVAGHVSFREVGGDVSETMELLVNGMAAPPEGQTGGTVDVPLGHLVPGTPKFEAVRSALKSGGTCDRCHQWGRLPLVTPCAHILCLTCVKLSKEGCSMPGCSQRYVMELPENLRRLENPNPKWSVPKDLIELQPSYAQDAWNPDWSATSSSKVVYLLERLKGLNPGKQPQDEPVDIGGPAKGRDSGVQPFLPFKENAANECELPEKAIVFSQFLEHISLLEAQLNQAGIRFGGMYSPRPGYEKKRALEEFKCDPKCCVLLMDSSGALGLDLSFVTHVFLMEPVWDRSLEEQIISRAWRMGALRPVLVETLIMRGTVEEQMLTMLQDPMERGRMRSQREQAEGTTRKEILQGLNFVTQQRPCGTPMSTSNCRPKPAARTGSPIIQQPKDIIISSSPDAPGCQRTSSPCDGAESEPFNQARGSETCGEQKPLPAIIFSEASAGFSSEPSDKLGENDEREWDAFFVPCSMCSASGAEKIQGRSCALSSSAGLSGREFKKVESARTCKDCIYERGVPAVQQPSLESGMSHTASETESGSGDLRRMEDRLPLAQPRVSSLPAACGLHPQGKNIVLDLVHPKINLQGLVAQCSSPAVGDKIVEGEPWKKKLKVHFADEGERPRLLERVFRTKS